MRYAIIQSGGKQYKAVEGQTVEVDRLDLEVGKKVEIKDVLLVSDEGNILVGAPTLNEAKVSATVLEQAQGPKITVFKYKPKIRYRVKTGHRQDLTRLQIDSIDFKGAKQTAAKEETPKAESVAAKPAAARRKTSGAKKAPAKAKAPARAKAKTKKK
ncbi:MAG: 50S ribosomal protein L21 [Anaerolineales bacterium]